MEKDQRSLTSKISSNTLLWLYLIILCFIYSVLLGSFFPIVYPIVDVFEKLFINISLEDDEYWFTILKTSILSIFFLSLILCVFINWLFKKKNIDSKKIFRVGILIVLTIPLFFILKDDPLVQFKYTWDKVPSVQKNAEESFQIFYENFWRNKSSKKLVIDLSDLDEWDAIKKPLFYEKQIIRKWEDIHYGRSLVDKLNEFDQIADLSKIENATEMDIIKLNHLMRIYYAYSMLMLEKGSFGEAAHTLAGSYSVVKNALPYARYTIHKIVWQAIAHQHIRCAYRIASNPNCDTETLKFLKGSFSPLTEEQTSCRGAYISEYFFIKDSFESMFKNDIVGYFCESSTLIEEKDCESIWNYYILKLFFTLNFRQQTSKNHLTVLMNTLLSDIDNQPPDFTESKKIFKKMRKPEFGNTAHSILSESSWTFIYPWELAERMLETKIFSDLFYIYLQHQLEEPYEINDYITGKKFIKTEIPGIYFSLGFDGEPSTDDDVSLIN